MSSTNGAIPSVPQLSSNKPEKPSNLVFGIGICMLAVSAGMTLYVKRSGSMLNRFYEVQQNQIRRGAIKVGPITREEWLATKPKW